MKKGIITLTLSAITAISAISSLNAVALCDNFDEEFFSTCIKLEDYEWLDNYIETYGETQCMYYKYNNVDDVFSIYEVMSTPDRIFISVPEEKANDILDQLTSIGDFHIIGGDMVKNSHLSFNIYHKASKMGIETVKKLHKAIGETTQEFKYYPDCLVYRTGTIWANQYENYDNNVLMNEKLSEYIESNNIEAELIELDTEGKFDEFKIVFTDEITPAEQLELAKKIYESTGFRPTGGSPTGMFDYETTPIDLTTYLNGDANCDSIQSMADAASIFQAIGNPDKYALSRQGEFNADFAGDGLTPDDAIAIQKKLAGIID